MANEFKVKKGLIIQGSGSTGDTTILDVQGNQGQLFSVTDSLSGSLFSVGDISGIPILEVFSDEVVKIGTFGSEAIIVNGSNVTASGNISASGTIVGSNLSGTNTGDQDLSSLALAANISGSFTAPSASFSTRVTLNDAKVSNIHQTTITGNAGTATVASGLTGVPDIIVGSLTATSITSSIVTSSIIYTEGSNIFGDAISDTHLFNGHITASGGISASGNILANQITASNSQFGSGGKIEIIHSGGSGVIDSKTANLTIKTSGNERISLSPAGAESLTVAHGGNVGIGTTTPDSILHLKDTGTPTITLEDSSGGTQTSTIKYSQDGQNQLYITTNYDSPTDLNRIYLQPGGETAMTLRGGDNSTGNAGNVGIGTTTPTERLEVIGNISASGDLIVDTIRSDEFRLKNADGTENMILGTADSGVTLYHDHQAKLSTLSTGISVTGTIQSTSHITASGNISASGKLIGGEVNINRDTALFS